MEDSALGRSVLRFESDIPLGWDKRGDAFQAFSGGALPAEPFFCHGRRLSRGCDAVVGRAMLFFLASLAHRGRWRTTAAYENLLTHMGRAHWASLWFPNYSEQAASDNLPR